MPLSKGANRAMDYLTGIVALGAVVVGGMRIREYVVARANEPGRPSEISSWREYASGGHRLGPAQPMVTIVEYADFQCPFCRSAEPVLRSLRRKYPQDIAVVYRHYPVHDLAVTAAIASECAAHVGAFEAIHDLFYAQADSIGTKPWTRFAVEAGVQDTASFSRCLTAGPGPRQALARDTTSGKRLGVSGTPTFLINNLKVSGFVSAEQLTSIVARAFDEAQEDDTPR